MKSTHKTRIAGDASVIIVAVVAVAALVIAWLAFNRSGDNLSTELQDTSNAAVEQVQLETNQAADEAELALARAEARAELVAIEAELEAEENYAEAAAALDEVQADLAASYENASVNAQTEWQEIQDDFSELGRELREGTATSLEVLAGLILQLETEVEPN